MQLPQGAQLERIWLIEHNGGLMCQKAKRKANGSAVLPTIYKLALQAVCCHLGTCPLHDTLFSGQKLQICGKISGRKRIGIVQPACTLFRGSDRKVGGILSGSMEHWMLVKNNRSLGASCQVQQGDSQRHVVKCNRNVECISSSAPCLLALRADRDSLEWLRHFCFCPGSTHAGCRGAASRPALSS